MPGYGSIADYAQTQLVICFNYPLFDGGQSGSITTEGNDNRLAPFFEPETRAADPSLRTLVADIRYPGAVESKGKCLYRRVRNGESEW
jgi:hypothetical protein